MSETLQRGPRDWALLLFLGLVWGGTFYVTKIAVAGWPAAAVVATRLSIGALAISGVCLAAGLAPARGRDAWLRFVVLGTVGNALPFFLITWGQEQVPSAVAGILMAVMPLATVVLAHFFSRGEPMTARAVAGFLLGFAGIVVLLAPEVGDVRAESAPLVREIAILAAALCYAINAILARRLPSTLHPYVSAAGTMTVASLVLLPFGIYAAMHAPVPPRATMIAVVWLGLVSTAVAMMGFFVLVQRAGATFLSLINYVIPLVATAVGVAVAGERLPWTAGVALVLVLAGMALSQWRR